LSKERSETTFQYSWPSHQPYVACFTTPTPVILLVEVRTPRVPWDRVLRVRGLAYIRQMRDKERICLNLAVEHKTARGFTAIGIFLFLGAMTASLAATTLLWRGTPLDRLWVLNPIAYKQLAPLDGTVGTLFLLLGAALTTAGIGWFRRRLWGWRLTVVIIATQVLGDLVNCVRGDLLGGGIGVVIAGALLLFLLQPKLRATFA
jgi:hypothetical protein